jgi:hypothetical protein
MHAYVLVPKSFIKFMFSTVYRLTQDFCARPYTSMLEPVLTAQISKLNIEAVELATLHMLINT